MVGVAPASPYLLHLSGGGGGEGAAEKAIQRQAWWKGKFALFWLLPATGWEGRFLSKGWLHNPPHHQQQSGLGKRFYRWREGAPCRKSTLSSDSRLEIGHVMVWSASLWLGTVDLQFQNWFVLVSQKSSCLFIWVWRRKWQPTPVFLPGESCGQRSLAGYGLCGCKVRHDWGTKHKHAY